MVRVTRRFIMLGAALALAGCMGNTDAASVTRDTSDFTVTSVTVNLKNDAQVVGRFAEDAALRKTVLDRVDATATELAKSKKGGPKKVRAVVDVSGMKLKTAGARSFGGVNEMWGQLTIVDAAGKTVKGPVAVAYMDQAKNNTSTINGIPVGLLFNLGNNSSAQETGKDVDQLVAGFAAQVAAKF